MEPKAAGGWVGGGQQTKAGQQRGGLEPLLVGASMQHLHLVSLCAEPG